MAVVPSANRMTIFNAFRKTPDGLWEMKNEQMIICACGWSDGFRVFPELDVARTVDKHNAECELRR